MSLLNNSNVKIPNKDIQSSEMCLTYGFIYPVAWTVEFIQTTKSIHLHCLTFLIYKRDSRFFLYTHIIPSWLINKAEVNPTDKWVVNRCELLFDKNWSTFYLSLILHLHFTCISAMQFQLKLMHKISQRYLTIFWLFFKLNNLHNCMLRTPFSFLI